MSQFEHSGKKYELIFGSDTINDGFFSEAWDCSIKPQELVLYAFYSDVDGSFTFTSFREDLPFELVEHFVDISRKRLPPNSLQNDFAGDDHTTT